MEVGDMDVDIARWILEFLVRQPLEDRVLNSLISTLPLTDENAGLKKSLLLRRIETEIAKGDVSEKILELLEQIEELDFRDKIRQHSDLLKAAYCSVAVFCTVKFLDSDGNRFEYFHAVKRIWRGKIAKMEKGEKVGLFSEELKSWADEIEAAVWDDSACDLLLNRSKEINASEAVRQYVKEEKEIMGPSFLELVAEASRNDDRLKGILGIKGGVNASTPTAVTLSVQRKDVNAETQGGNVLPRLKYAACKRTRVAVSGKSRGARITDADASDARTCNSLSSPDVSEVREALKSSSLELKAVVKDPLPDALHFAKAVVSDVSNKDRATLPVEDSHNRTHPAGERSRPVQANGELVSRVASKEPAKLRVEQSCNGANPAGESSRSVQTNRDIVSGDASKETTKLPVQQNRNGASPADESLRPPQANGEKASGVASKETVKLPVQQSLNEAIPAGERSRSAGASGEDRGNDCQQHEKNAPRPSLMARNGTAHTMEWNDSVEETPDSSNIENRPRLHEPRTRAVSPLRIYEGNNLKRRRKIKRWSLLEEDTLRTGVETYGRGNWKLILNAYRDVFEERTEVNLVVQLL
ncbi:OLC1v1006444C2 [Oldenlandia corymbosa var. corymbosa]|uniref:OLC1v1006444C2 n=1 Tax=Oldenlandia corymbosa var. corymbosa TaxID=529605 RepID=A0AAV1DHM5_OLDCO|nr:OLC1v1006444C2 [Oldenlandia corymbosa var. corymbosa]